MNKLNLISRMRLLNKSYEMTSYEINGNLIIQYKHECLKHDIHVDNHTLILNYNNLLYILILF